MPSDKYTGRELKGPFMPPYCLNAIGATGGQFPSMNLEFGPLRIAGIVAPDAYALSLPFDAVVLPDTTSLASDAARFSGSIFPAVMRNHQVGPREICFFTDLIPGRQVVKVENDYVHLSGDEPGIRATTTTVSVLDVAAQLGFSAIMFILPPGSGWLSQDLASSAFANAIFTFVRNFEPGSLREVVVCADSEGFLRDIFGELEDARRNYYEASPYRVDPRNDRYVLPVRAFLNDRSRPESKAPSLIPPSSAFLDFPIHMAKGHSGTEVFSQSPDVGPPKGYIRLVPNSLVDRAMQMVPEFVRGHGPGHPPPFILARLIQDGAHGEFRVSAGRESLIVQPRGLISHRGFLITERQTKKDYMLSEIGICDVPREALAHSDLIRHLVISPFFPKSTSRFIRHIVDRNLLPDAVIERIERDFTEPEITGFSVKEIDEFLSVMILQQCSAIFWNVLPLELKRRWMEMYPAEGNEDNSYVYFRNLIRIYTEGDQRTYDGNSFFAQETFADVLGLYWAGENLTTYHRRMSGGVVERHRAFLDEVMAWARAKFEREGTVFDMSSFNLSP